MGSIFEKVKYLLPIKLPKEVVIFNGRLSMLFIVTQIMVVVGFVYLFIHLGKQHLIVQTPVLSPPIFWRESMSEYADKVALDGTKEVCDPAKNEKFAFFSTPDYVYKDYKCIEIPPEEMFMKLGYTVGYFPTFFEEKRTESYYVNSATECSTVNDGCYTATSGMNATQKTAAYNALTEIGGQKWWQYDRANSPWLRKEKSYGTGMKQCECQSTANYVVKGIAAQNFVIDHSYEDSTPDSTTGAISGTERGRASYSAEKASDKGRPIVSVIEKFDADEGKFVEFDCGQPVAGQCRYKPGTFIRLSLEQWGKAGGVNLADADSINVDIPDPNGFQTGITSENLPTPADSTKYVSNPILRLSGVELTLKIAYYEELFVDEDYGLEGNEIVARIQVKVSAGSWASQPMVDYGSLPFAGGMKHMSSASTRSRYFFGVRFVILQGTMGKFGHFVLQALIAFMAVVAVYLGLVTKLMKVVATTMLGDTSRSYKRAQLDSFNMDRDAQQVAPGMILAAAGSFRTLCDAAGQHCIIQRDETTGMQKRYLTQAAVQNILTRVFNENLDAKGIAIMASNVYTSISTDENFGNEKAVGRQSQTEGQTDIKTDGEEPIPGIDLNSFVRAVCRNMVIDFEALANLYDVSDEKGCIEKMFGEQVHLHHGAEIDDSGHQADL